MTISDTDYARNRGEGSAKASQHAAWAAAHGRLWGDPGRPSPTKIVAPRRPVSPFQRKKSDFIGPPTRIQWLFPEAIIEVDPTGSRDSLIWSRPAWMKVAKEVATKHGVTVKELRSARRDRVVVAARHEAFWRCSKDLAMTLPQIGRCFGDRDHTTVLHGVRMHEKRMREAAKGALTEEEFRETIA